jgi:hypothetical protein
VSESALVAFASLVQSDSQVREQVREAATPKHVVDLASAQGDAFNQATLMKMQADKMKHLHDDHLYGATSWGEALLLCFGGHS